MLFYKEINSAIGNWYIHCEGVDSGTGSAQEAYRGYMASGDHWTYTHSPGDFLDHGSGMCMAFRASYIYISHVGRRVHHVCRYSSQPAGEEIPAKKLLDTGRIDNYLRHAVHGRWTCRP